jgi:hypothetical protein
VITSYITAVTGQGIVYPFGDIEDFVECIVYLFDDIED